MNITSPMRLQKLFALHDEILQKRLETVLPQVMDECGIDMWIVIGDEYNEGPVVRSLLPSAFFHARRTAAFIFTRKNGVTMKMIASKPDFSIDRFYTPVLLKPKGLDWETFYTTFATKYDIEKIREMEEEDLFGCIGRLIRENDPDRIALDFSQTTPFSDGLSWTNYEKLCAHIHTKYQKRFVSAEDISVRFLETRIDEEIALMQQIVMVSREIVKECYSTEVIIPGVTTTGEARFHLMERATNLGMPPWFDATMWIRRKGDSHIDDDNAVIKKGDILHCDFGVIYGNLCSDIQEMAYVKDDDDEQLIEELDTIHRTCMRFQDIVIEQFSEGRSGNEILARSLAQAKSEGIAKPMLYSHPIGLFGHGPGPTIGSFTNQQYVEGGGERTVHDRTCYALELNIREKVASWDDLEIMWGQEIDILFKDGKARYFAGRQTELHIIA
ncbi:MAG: M24 family metallopeptidase [Sphaerochaetaceae bacterium]|nr:M24 family metallopeptidase [Sphaerochaetaceae bacterium]